MCASGWNGVEKEKQSRKDIVRREQLHYNKKQICNMRRDEQMQKKNYQKELDKKDRTDRIGKEGSTSVPSQLLCTMQQLCAGISVGIF